MKLTDEQKTALNVGLNEWAGWEWVEPTGIEGYPKYAYWKPPVMRAEDMGELVYPPNYCSNLNAINRLEERLTESQQHLYVNWLHEVTGTRLWGMFTVLHASAEQRAIALARTLNLNIAGVTQ